jgi:hypothetical protein
LKHRILNIFIILFLIICIFDPADKITGLKVELFILCWLIFGLLFFTEIIESKIRFGLITYIFLMILIPVVSIFLYQLSNNVENTEGIQLLKSHIFISFAFLLVIAKINLVTHLSVLLSLLSSIIIAISILTAMYPLLQLPIQLFGEKYGVLLSGTRFYSESVGLKQIYYVTSPMIVIPIVHYLHLAISHVKKSKYIILTIINFTGIFLAGTRSNMLGGILCLLIVLLISSRKKYFIIFTISIGLFALIWVLGPEINQVFSLAEKSNSIKLGLLKEYSTIFNNPKTLLFGQGLGSYYYWEIKGFSAFITELSYLEIIRTLGLFLGLPMLGLIFFPIIYSYYSHRLFSNKIIIVAYVVYLGMAALNPLIFSSLGMTIIATIIANIFMSDETILDKHNFVAS